MHKNKVLGIALTICLLFSGCSSNTENSSSENLQDNVSSQLLESSVSEKSLESDSPQITDNMSSETSQSEKVEEISGYAFLGKKLGEVKELLNTDFNKDGGYNGAMLLSPDDETVPYSLLADVIMTEKDSTRITGVLVNEGGNAMNGLVGGMSVNEMKQVVGEDYVAAPTVDEFDGSYNTVINLGKYSVIVYWWDYTDDNSPSAYMNVYKSTKEPEDELTPEEQAELEKLYNEPVDFGETESGNTNSEPIPPEVWIEPEFSCNDIPDIPDYQRSIQIVKGFTAIFGENGHCFKNPIITKETFSDGDFTYTVTDDSGEYSYFKCEKTKEEGVYKVNEYSVNQNNCEHLIGMEIGLYKINGEYYYQRGATYSGNEWFNWEVPNGTYKQEYLYDLDDGNAYFGNFTFISGQLAGIDAINFANQKNYTTDDSGNIVSEPAGLKKELCKRE